LIVNSHTIKTTCNGYSLFFVTSGLHKLTPSDSKFC
jgi:hypothetical protein